MACIITHDNKKYTQPEFNEYFKSHFFEFASDFLGSKQDIEGFKEFVNKQELNKPVESRRNKRTSVSAIHNYNQAQDEDVEVGDNYALIVAQKVRELEKVENELVKVNVKIQSKSSPTLEGQKKTLMASKLRLQEQIRYLQDNQQELMYHAIEQDIADIREILESDNFHDIDRVSETIDFYSTLSFPENPDLNSKLRELEQEYPKLIRDKVINFLKSNEKIQLILENINADTEAGKEARSKFGKAEGEKAQFSDLLNMRFDLPWWDTYTLGVISSNTSDSVLPAILLETFFHKLNTNQNNVITLIEKLTTFNKENPDIDKNALRELDEDGNETGDLVGVYSTVWDSAMRNKNELRQSFIEATDFATRMVAYNNLFDWHKENTDIIDFTKLKVFADIYGGFPEYSEYFQATEAEMDAYEAKLKALLGPQYEHVISKLEKKLQDYQSFISDHLGIDPSMPEFADFENKRLTLDIWAFKEKFENNDKTQTQSTSGLDFERYFTDFSNDFFLPKQTIETTEFDYATGQVETYNRDSGYYSKDFDIVKNDAKLSELWSIYKEMGDYINATYGLTANSKVVPPKIPLIHSEKVYGALSGLLQGKIGGFTKTMTLDNLDALKSMYFGEKSKNESDEMVKSNYQDSFKQELKAEVTALVMQGYSYEEATKRARKKLLKTYSNDIDRNFTATLMGAALHNARTELAPFAAMVEEVYANINPDRKRGIARMEAFLDKTVFNRPKVKAIETGTIVDKVLKLNTTTPFLFHALTSGTSGKTSKGKMWLHKRFTSYTDQEKVILKDLEKVYRQGAVKGVDISETVNGKYFSFASTNIAKDGENPVYSYIITNEEGKKVAVTEEMYNNYVDAYVLEKIQTLGQGFTIRSFWDGLMAKQVITGLAFSPISGIFNRNEGMITTDFVDAMGEYWTPGNNIRSERFLGFANTIGLLQKFNNSLPDAIQSDVVDNIAPNLKVFREVVQRIGGTQDRSTELERATKQRSGLDSLKNLLYAWSVDNPEFKNQGQTALNVMQDFMVTDRNGEQKPFFDGKTLQFSMFEFSNGKVELKKNEEGEALFDVDLQEFFESEQMSQLASKIHFAIAKTNGNYFNYDVATINNVMLGQAAALYKRWFFEHWQQRWQRGAREGEFNINVSTGEVKKEGRYVAALQGSPALAASHFAGLIGIRAGGWAALAGSGVVGAGVSVVSLIATALAIKSGVNKKDLNEKWVTISHFLEYFKAVVLETLNIPTKFLQAIPGVNRLRINTTDNRIEFFNTFKNSQGLTEHQQRALKVMAKEMALQLSVFAAKYAVAIFLYGDDDDDKESEARRRYNFIQNQLSRLSGTLTTFYDAETIIGDQMKIGLLKDIETTFGAANKVFKGEIGEATADMAYTFLPVPRTAVRREAGDYLFLPSPIESGYNVDRTTILGRGNWKFIDDVARDNATGGEHSAGKEWTELREEKREELKKKYKSEGLNPGEKGVKAAIENEIDAIFNKKKNKDTKYKELIDDPYSTKNKNHYTKISNLRKNLKSEGYSKEEIDKIIEVRKK